MLIEIEEIEKHLIGLYLWFANSQLVIVLMYNINYILIFILKYLN